MRCIYPFIVLSLVSALIVVSMALIKDCFIQMPWHDLGFSISHTEGAVDAPWHAGVIAPGTCFDVDWCYENPYDSPLTIVGTKVSCSCVQIQSMPSVIPTGKNSIAKLRVRANRKPGLFKQSILVYADTEDGAPATAYLPMTATVKGTWAEPATVLLTDVQIGDTADTAFVFHAAGFPDARISSVTCDIPHVECVKEPAQRVVNSSSPNDITVSVPCSVSLSPQLVPGDYSGSVTIRFEEVDDSAGTLTVPVSLSLKGRVTCIPDRLILNTISENRSLSLQSRDGQTIDYRKVEIQSSHPAVTGEIVPIDDTAATLIIELDGTRSDSWPLTACISGHIGQERIFQVDVTSFGDASK